MCPAVPSAPSCHSEPVRAAKQAPLGYTLAWESVFRCGAAALTGRRDAVPYANKPAAAERPPDTRKHTVLPVSIRLKSTEKTPACVSMWAFLQPISARIYFGKTASHRKRARFVQSRGASPQAYWMSVKAAQRWGCAKRAFCGVCFLMPGGLIAALRFSHLGGAGHTMA